MRREAASLARGARVHSACRSGPVIPTYLRRLQPLPTSSFSTPDDNRHAIAAAPAPAVPTGAAPSTSHDLNGATSPRSHQPPPHARARAPGCPTFRSAGLLPRSCGAPSLPANDANSGLLVGRSKPAGGLAGSRGSEARGGWRLLRAGSGTDGASGRRKGVTSRGRRGSEGVRGAVGRMVYH